MNPENNFNTHDTNDVSNNQTSNNQYLNQNIGINQQSINSQIQATSNYQNPINMQQQTPQSVNTFKNSYASNQFLNNKLPKKKILSIIIVIAGIVAVVGIVATLFLINNQKDDDNDNVNNNNKINENTSNSKEDISSIKLAHDIFDVSKFDSTLFNGVVYDSNQKEYNVMDLLKTDHTFCIKGCLPIYYLTSNIDVEIDSWNQRSDSTDNKGIDFILKTLGNPSTIYESYHNLFDKKDYKTGNISIIYNYNDYIIDIGFYDYRQWKNSNYTSLQISHVMIYTKERFNSEWAPFFKNYEAYGEKLF